MGARHTPPILRAAAVVALVGAVIAVALLLTQRDDRYVVRATFEDAGQLVPGGLVQVAGATVGKVGDIELTDDGMAEVTLELRPDWGPLRQGTRAIVRAPGMSTAAGRYVDLMLGPANAPAIPDGGRLPPTATTAAVDLDQVLDLFDERTRKGLQRVLRGSSRQFAGRGALQNEALRYLDPSLVATTRLFGELNRNQPMFARFLTASGRLSRDLAQQKLDLAGLVRNGATTTNAIARDRTALARAVAQLPGFLRQSNSTLVDVRTTLDTLRPLVREATPVTRRLLPLVRDVRLLFEQAPPTVREITASTAGAIELGRATLALAPTALGPVRENGAEREGSLPGAAKALRATTPMIAYARPYAPELTGWFDDFGHSGQYDANGSFARTSLGLSAFSARGNAATFLQPAERGPALLGAAAVDQNNRCPGALERDPGDGSTPWRPSADYNCDPSQKPLGP